MWLAQNHTEFYKIMQELFSGWKFITAGLSSIGLIELSKSLNIILLDSTWSKTVNTFTDIGIICGALLALGGLIRGLDQLLERRFGIDIWRFRRIKK